MSKFYRAFEERYRGPRQLIKDRLKSYLPFLLPIIEANMGKVSVDLGCGRGEWLELASEKGLAIQGIDLDSEMLEPARALGLAVSEADAIEYMIDQLDDSLAIVSAFHLVEHLPFQKLQKLIEESRRALMPGGLVIFETPNPENISVATTNFHLDPTHVRPIPPLLLSFLFEYAGFETVKIVRLQEPVELRTSEKVKLSDVFNGVSPDYAIVAQKPGNSYLTAALKDAFSKQYGIPLSDLLKRYDNRTDTAELRLDNVEGKLEADVLVRLAELSSATSITLQQLSYLINRSLWEKLLFTPGGKPKRILRRILFHKSGRPRGVFKAAIFHKDGRPHRPFKMWIESQEYLKMQGVAHRDRRKATLGRAQLASVQIMVALSSAQHLQSQESVNFLEVDHDA